MQQQEIKITLDEKTAGGAYSNVALISHNENEFIADFIFAQPPVGRVNARVIMSPSHAKRLLKALSQNIEMFEKKFGAIKEEQDAPDMRINLSAN
ncbi:MAG: DUF3467 domain-containing protein [Candidatus Saganbacteria bacterium]|nr:DUF3467 domain-containing protein [Candidatus Saganbacteria bacterium]